MFSCAKVVCVCLKKLNLKIKYYPVNTIDLPLEYYPVSTINTIDPPNFQNFRHRKHFQLFTILTFYGTSFSAMINFIIVIYSSSWILLLNGYCLFYFYGKHVDKFSYFHIFNNVKSYTSVVIHISQFMCFRLRNKVLSGSVYRSHNRYGKAKIV